MMMISSGADLIDAIVKDRHNTVIFYENIYPAISIFKRILDSTDEEITVLAITGPVLKTLSEIEEHTGLDLGTVKIVALNMDGKGGDVAFSYEQLDELIEFIGKLRGTLIMLGRGLLKIVVEDYQKMLLKIFETASNDLKIIAFTNWKSCSDEELAAISGMFDVSIHIQKTDEVFSFGDEIYELNVIQSVVTYIPPGTVYFRVGENLEIEEQT